MTLDFSRCSKKGREGGSSGGGGCAKYIIQHSATKEEQLEGTAYLSKTSIKQTKHTSLVGSRLSLVRVDLLLKYFQQNEHLRCTES